MSGFRKFLLRGNLVDVRIPGVWARPGAWPCRAQTSWGKRACPLLVSLASVPDTKLGQSWETSKCPKLEG